MDVDRRRNCYNCREFGYITKHCRNQRIWQGRQISYQNNNKNLNNSRDIVGQQYNKIGHEFVRKQEFKLKKIRRLIYVRNVDGIFNKEGLIEIFFFNSSNFSCISFIIFAFFNIYYINFKEHREGIQRKNRNRCDQWLEVECNF